MGGALSVAACPAIVAVGAYLASAAKPRHLGVQG
jgi:hypothetical protein